MVRKNKDTWRVIRIEVIDSDFRLEETVIISVDHNMFSLTDCRLTNIFAPLVDKDFDIAKHIEGEPMTGKMRWYCLSCSFGDWKQIVSQPTKWKFYQWRSFRENVNCFDFLVYNKMLGVWKSALWHSPKKLIREKYDSIIGNLWTFEG